VALQQSVGVGRLEFRACNAETPSPFSPLRISWSSFARLSAEPRAGRFTRCLALVGIL
jgi:hypothetical protein